MAARSRDRKFPQDDLRLVRAVSFASPMPTGATRAWNLATRRMGSSCAVRLACTTSGAGWLHDKCSPSQPLGLLMTPQLIAIAFAFMLGGCATVPMGESSKDAALKEFRPPQERAGIYIFRSEVFGAAIKLDVLLDGKEIGQTAARTFLYVDVAPGTHTITSKGENTDSVQVELVAGTLSYVWQEVKIGLLYARTKLHVVGDLEGKNGVMGTRLASTTVPRPSSEVAPRAVPTSSTGTGFAIQAPASLVTAYHVIKGATRIDVSCAEGQSMRAEIQKIDPANDLALLKLPVPAPAHLELAPDNSVSIGQRVFTIGFPVPGILGKDAKYSDGSISSLSGLGGAANLLQLTVPIQPGNSGGPVADEAGRVVGVVTSTAAVQSFFRNTGALPQNVNWAVRSEYLRPLLSAVRPESSTASKTPIEHVNRSSCLIVASTG